ncbi:5-formyltetrahydrofolate cyclo-ligase [Nonomuraea antimicrobica]|uniref:5-formyltetrahydrofolate cyclo-ligase n=1 Tax=Nonomuraea antimicrobica TaxID=561173 RepID=A0ABP7ERS2_9ACTN
MADIDRAKQAVRERVWTLLEQSGAAEAGVRGYIPTFNGADEAAERLTTLAAWQRSQVVKAVPDQAQLPVRMRALREGKIVYMAVPKLAEAPPFYLLDPRDLPVSACEAADRAVAARIAPKVGVEEMRPVDLVVCGSVAVNQAGVRLGKGAGYSDIEVALLAEAGLLSDETTIVTTVHELQVLDEELPEDEHDFHVDLIVTPERVIACTSPKRPTGLSWERMSPEKIAAIPVVAKRALSRDSTPH